MYVLVTYKNEDQMKNDCDRVIKTLYSYILDAQGQHSVVGGRVENQTHSSFYVSLLPARMRKIHPKIKAL